MGFINVGYPHDRRKFKRRRISDLHGSPDLSLMKKDRVRQTLTKPTPRIYQKLELISLPPEILYNIFCYINIKENKLNLVNKNFYSLFTLEKMGSHYLKRLISLQFLINLNEKWEYLQPYTEKLIESFKIKKINTDCFKTFIKNYHVFMSVKCGLNHDIFKYKFGYELALHYYTQYFISNESRLINEQKNRHKYIKLQLKKLNDELSEYNQQRNDSEINFDELSRMANRLFEQDERPGQIQQEGGEGEEEDEEDAEDRNEEERNNETEDTIDLQLNYKTSNCMHPKFPKKFKNIGSMEKFQKVKRLVNELNFTYDDLNEVLINVLNSKLTLKHRCKVIHFLTRTYLDPNATKYQSKQKIKTNPLYIKDFNISTYILLKAFEILLDSRYDSKFESVVHELLTIYYQRHNAAIDNQAQEGGEEADRDIRRSQNQDHDAELWNFVKETKQTELFQILCGYSAPRFTL